MDPVTAIKDGLVVSCQAPDGHPLRDPHVIALLARCADLGGATGLRVNGPDDLRSVKTVSSLPLIGLHKFPRPNARPLITPAYALCEALAEAGADIIALETTDEAAQSAAYNPLDLLEQVRTNLGLPVMADVSTLEEGIRAWNQGADLVSTTLSGYTPYTAAGPAPDLTLVADLAAHGIRTVAEGRLSTKTHVTEAFTQGAWSVVIGTAITDPLALTKSLTPTPPGTHP